MRLIGRGAFFEKGEKENEATWISRMEKPERHLRRMPTPTVLADSQLTLCNVETGGLAMYKTSTSFKIRIVQYRNALLRKCLELKCDVLEGRVSFGLQYVVYHDAHVIDSVTLFLPLLSSHAPSAPAYTLLPAASAYQSPTVVHA